MDAVERLLEKKAFEEISIAEIVGVAKTTSGSFYARFASKEAVLPFLYQRYHEEASAEVDRVSNTLDWSGVSLREAVARFVGLAFRYPKERPWRLRTMSLFARTNPEAIPAAAKERSRRTYAVVSAAMAGHVDQIRRPDPDRALAFISFVVMTAARERLAFPDAPLASALPHDPAEFEHELETLMHAYLTAVERRTELES